MCRAFSPWASGGAPTWAFGPGWYVARFWRFSTDSNSANRIQAPKNPPCASNFRRTGGRLMPIRQLAVERFSVVSARPMDDVLAAIDAAIGHPNLGQMHRDVGFTTTYAEMEAVIRKGLDRKRVV